MIHFAQIHYIFLLLLIPVFFILYGIMRKIRMKRVEKFGEPKMVEKLLPNSSKKKGWVKLSFFSLAFFFFVIGLARPQIGATLKEKEQKGVEIMIALDVSNSMLAQDYTPDRLERAKLAISKLVDKLHDDRIGLIVFAGRSFVQLPITTDYVSAKTFLSTISTKSIPVQGTDMEGALKTAVRSFSLQDKNSRAIIMITDGENHEGDPVSVAKDAASMGIRVFTIGVGSSQGQPIPMDGALLKDKDGKIVVTKLDEKTLINIAKAGNGEYVRAGKTEFGLNPVINEIKNMDGEKYKSQVFEEYDEQYMYFFGLALLFLLLEMMIRERKNKKSLFGGASGTRAWSIMLVLLIIPFTATAQNINQNGGNVTNTGNQQVSQEKQNKDVSKSVIQQHVKINKKGQRSLVDTKEVRSGNRSFKKAAYKKSEIDYKRALLKDSLSVTANYNLGNTLYRMKNTDEAIKNYQNADNVLKSYEHNYENAPEIFSDSPKVIKKANKLLDDTRKKTADVNFNLGNSYLSLKKYQEAVDAYKESLRRNPSDMDAKSNLAYAQKMLKDQQKKDQQNKNNKNDNKNKNKQDKKKQNQDQDKQNQDKNKQNQDQNKQNQDKNKQNQDKQNQSGSKPKITPQAARQMLQAIQDKEKKTQEKVKKEKAKALKGKEKEKNW